MPELTLYQSAQALGACLKARGLCLALAESCTGGWIAKSVTDVPGSSVWFDSGVVSYSNEAKIALLGVDALTLARDGAVSQIVAQQMVCGAITRSQANTAIAVTGIAGPDGGSDEKPVGLVWIAWGLLQNGNIILKTESHRFEGGRDMVRYQTVETAMKGMATWLGEVL